MLSENPGPIGVSVASPDRGSSCCSSVLFETAIRAWLRCEANSANDCAVIYLPISFLADPGGPFFCTEQSHNLSTGDRP